MRTRFWSALIVMLATALCGCGQTGALYLPDQDGEAVGPKAETSITVVPAGDAADAEAARKRADSPQPAPK